MLFYEEVRNKLKNQSKSNKNINNHKIINDKKSHFNIYNTNKENNLNSQNISNIKKSKSFFLSKKLQELQYIPSYINKRENKQNKRFSYIFKNLHNYPLPEPLPKKIDIRIINNNSNFNTNNINNTTSMYKNKDDKSIYDDKKILFILLNLGLENLFSKFKDNCITFNDLKFLTKEDFIEMKIPIGPRNRIIHFIRELQKVQNNLDFEGLKNFIEKYKIYISEYKPKGISENNKKNEESLKIIDLNNNKYIINDSQYESEKIDNISIFDKYKNDSQYNNSFFSYNKSNNNYNKSNINILDNYNNFNFNHNNNSIHNDKIKYCMENKLRKYLIHSENQKNNKLYPKDNDKDNAKNNDNDNNDNIYKKQLNHYNSFLSCNLNNKDKNKDKDKDKDDNNNQNYRRNYSQNIRNKKINNYSYKNILTYNNEFIKFAHLKSNSSNFAKYNEYVPKTKNKKNKNNIKKQNKENKENIKYNTTTTHFKNNQNNSFHSNYYNLSKNLLNKYDIINKEVEKYQINYERLKNETKRRNKNVMKILSSNSFVFRNNNIYKRNKYNICNDKKIKNNHNKDLDEKEKNLKIELNNFNYKIKNFKFEC